MRSFAEALFTYDPIESRLTAPVSERMLDLLGLSPGMRVLDLAGGCVIRLGGATRVVVARSKL